MVRIYLVGTSGSGKTTLARALSQRIGISHMELDAIHHQPNWTPLPIDHLRAEVTSIASNENWVIDGNYSKVQDVVLARCTTLVILDYSRPLVMKRVIVRSLLRVITRAELWNGNRETFKSLLSRDPNENVILWAWTTHKKRRAHFDVLEKSVSPSVEVFRLSVPSQAKKLLKALATTD
jgi:adenylate kinase family enzyme